MINPETIRRWLRRIAAMIVLASGTILILGVIRVRQNERAEVCVKHLAALARAVHHYSNEHTNRFPPAATWCDAIESKVDWPEVEKCFQCPDGASSHRSHYAFNLALAGVEQSSVDPWTVMLFETTGGWNVNGGWELTLQKPRHFYVTIALANGITLRMDASRLNTLRWNP